MPSAAALRRPRPAASKPCSAPKPSRATVPPRSGHYSSGGGGRRWFDDLVRDYLTPGVGPAGRADPMRQPRAVTARALVEARVAALWVERRLSRRAREVRFLGTAIGRSMVAPLRPCAGRCRRTKGHTARGLCAVWPPSLPPCPRLDIHRNSHGKRQARQRGRLRGSPHGSTSHRAPQLIELGLRERPIDHRLSCGRLHRLSRRLCSRPHAVERDRPWMAAVLSCGPDALLSHRSAAALWGIVPSPPRRREVTVGTIGAPSGICVHRPSLTPADRTLINGVPVTSLPRTLLDLAAGAPWSLERALEESESSSGSYLGPSKS